VNEITAPTRTALAAKAFMDRIGSDAHQQAIENAAILGGWVGSREAGSRDVALSDAIAKAALDRVMDLFRTWAAECDDQADSVTGRCAECDGVTWGQCTNCQRPVCSACAESGHACGTAS
jgi:hypothetical protein